MASGWRLQLGLATGLGVLALTAACEPTNASPADRPVDPVLDAVMETALPPLTSLVVITTVAVTVPGGQVQDCVDYVQFGALTGAPDMSAMWDAAGHDVDRLRQNCVSLGRGDPASLAALSERRRELDAYLAAQLAATGTTEPAGPVPARPG